MKKRKHFNGSDIRDFDEDELLRTAEVAEHAIIKWTLELSDALDIPIDELANLRKKLKDFLDEEVY